MADRFVVGVDGGTEGLRAGVFDLHGEMMSSYSSPYPTHFPHPSWAEQNPEDWWAALGEATRGAVAAAGIRPEQINRGGAGPVSAEWMIPKSLWLKQNEPHTYEATAHMCEYQDYINYRLTGRMCASINCWPTSMLDTLGLSDLVQKWPKDILALGDKVGGLTAEASKHLGLPEGTLVAQGGADSFIGMIGLGVRSEEKGKGKEGKGTGEE
eukprot:gene30476-35489_t